MTDAITSGIYGSLALVGLACLAWFWSIQLDKDRDTYWETCRKEAREECDGLYRSWAHYRMLAGSYPECVRDRISWLESQAVYEPISGALL